MQAKQPSFKLKWEP